MNRPSRTAPALLIGLCLALMLAEHGMAQMTTTTTRAHGTFEVTLTPQPAADGADTTLSRLRIDKQFRGDLEGTSNGQMLAAATPVKASAGYVAIERVTATLHGRSGSFTLQHTGTMNRGDAQLSVTVVPDSASGQLEGLTGRMSITITDGKHFYDFDYTLPARP